ncbi:hypothetical protein CEXT_397881 [Caerostris extrusa]|uniref:Uncharacterized protein n=1 Tax=Caerostris extrusa TaxID=172846 RepID=A0AAV4P657_CAEEX|nr:hypothetical protein CEXT_397881 [Caerostris extrusa]
MHINSVMKLRKQITIPELRRSARKPCRKLNLKIPSYYEIPPPSVVSHITHPPLPSIAATVPPETLAIID